jgi:hypothetical protein
MVFVHLGNGEENHTLEYHRCQLKPPWRGVGVWLTSCLGLQTQQIGQRLVALRDERSSRRIGPRTGGRQSQRHPHDWERTIHDFPSD